MKKKYQRAWLIVFSLVAVIAALGLIYPSFKDNIIFFYSPTDLASGKHHVSSDKMIRVGGLVMEESVLKKEGMVTFVLTDYKHEIMVKYQGVLPNLFREGQGIVANGYYDGNIVKAETLLAKHDENYMPKEVYNSLKEQRKAQ